MPEFPSRSAEIPSLFQEHIVRGIGHAPKRPRGLAISVEGAAARIDALNRRDARQRPSTTVARGGELEPRNVRRAVALRLAHDLARDRTAVRKLLSRTGIVAADRLIVQKEAGDRLAQDPGEGSFRVGLAFVNLRAFGVDFEQQGLTRRALWLRARFANGPGPPSPALPSPRREPRPPAAQPRQAEAARDGISDGLRVRTRSRGVNSSPSPPNSGCATSKSANACIAESCLPNRNTPHRATHAIIVHRAARSDLEPRRRSPRGHEDIVRCRCARSMPCTVQVIPHGR